MTEKLNTWSVQWLGVVTLITVALVCVCMCVHVCAFVCYRVSRWVYVIRTVQADAELIVLGELQGGK